MARVALLLARSRSCTKDPTVSDPLTKSHLRLPGALADPAPREPSSPDRAAKRQWHESIGRACMKTKIYWHALSEPFIKGLFGNAMWVDSVSKLMEALPNVISVKRFRVRIRENHFHILYCDVGEKKLTFTNSRLIHLNFNIIFSQELFPPLAYQTIS